MLDKNYKSYLALLYCFLNCNIDGFQVKEEYESIFENRAYAVIQPVYDACFTYEDSTLVTLERSSPAPKNGFYELRMYRQQRLIDSLNLEESINGISCIKNDNEYKIVISMHKNAGLFNIRVLRSGFYDPEFIYINKENPEDDGMIDYSWRQSKYETIEVISKFMRDSTYIKYHGLDISNELIGIGREMWYGRTKIVSYSFRDDSIRMYDVRLGFLGSVKSIGKITAAQSDNLGRFILGRDNLQNRDQYIYDIENDEVFQVPFLAYGWWGAMYSCGDSVILTGSSAIDVDQAVIILNGQIRVMPTNLTRVFDDDMYLYRTYRVEDGYELRVTPRDACEIGVP